MRRLWTIIGVRDVGRSQRWYQSLLCLPQTEPAHTYFGQVVDADGTVLVCLHEWDAHDHPTLTSPDLAQPGNGPVSYTHLRAHETPEHLVCRLLLEKKK